ncbi:nucleoside-diphosphate sugar epimerase [Solibacillus sp. A46]|uniref:Nucleoside-diphosphate sugar epimerase n=1 Tax=Solibacillus faecavium TaxID=2762221 RepID=A0ABR8XZR7_9BACL|nr:nucleoside-diphosphate sugar epimerase [Solibacillus faecavium]MBD8037443.1 nucleoside-diphosphate sugar epimerase [Solibacillus faecavium]
MLRLSWLISLGISLFGVMIIQHFFTVKPDDVADGGNLGALGLALVAPFILLSLFITYRFFVVSSRNAKDHIIRMIYFIFGVALLVVLIFYAIDFKDSVYASLGGDTTTPGSTIFGFPILNEYTNHVFLNFYTFGIIHTISGLIGTIVGMVKPDKQIQP